MASSARQYQLKTEPRQLDGNLLVSHGKPWHLLALHLTDALPAYYFESGGSSATVFAITGSVHSHGIALMGQVSLLPYELLTPQRLSFLNTAPAIPTSTASHDCHTCHDLATSCQ
jgi:hypothetical protein